MSNSRRLTLKSFLAASVATAVLGAGAAPAAHAGPKTTATPTTTTDTTTTDTTTTVTKDTKTSSTGRKVG